VREPRSGMNQSSQRSQLTSLQLLLFANETLFINVSTSSFDAAEIAQKLKLARLSVDNVNLFVTSNDIPSIGVPLTSLPSRPDFLAYTQRSRVTRESGRLQNPDDDAAPRYPRRA